MISASSFRRQLYQFFHQHGRRLPWREPLLKPRQDGTLNPYRILVSEVMLQQTQVARVISKYQSFVKKWPTVEALAGARLSEVLCEWQGLGYNRRGKALHAAARLIVADHKGLVPQSREALKALPGIGDYTAGAIRAFAFNEPDLFLETNIRTVLLHHVHQGEDVVDDATLLATLERVLDRKRPRYFYTAMMDYGAHLKTSGVKLNARSKGYRKQSRFKGSDREIRGALLAELVKGKANEEELIRFLPFEKARIQAQLARLVDEGLLRKWRGSYCIND